jgi:hypothetical protein
MQAAEKAAATLPSLRARASAERAMCSSARRMAMMSEPKAAARCDGEATGQATRTDVKAAQQADAAHTSLPRFQRPARSSRTPLGRSPMEPKETVHARLSAFHTGLTGFWMYHQLPTTEAAVKCTMLVKTDAPQ